MALIICPECGRENVSDSAEMCPSCGFPVKKYFDELKSNRETITGQHNNDKDTRQVETIECHEEGEKVIQDNVDNANKVQKARKNHKNTNVIIGVCIGIISIIVAIYIAIPKLKYSNANALFEQGNYEEALMLFENMGDYKDALVKVEECKLKIIKDKIDTNVELEESLAYLSHVEYTDEVIAIRNECILKLIYINYDEKNYIDTLKYIYETEETDQFKDIKTDCLWNMANAEYNEGNYLQVIRYLDEIGNLTSLEADRLLQQSLNKYGVDLYNDGDFSSALMYLTRVNPKDDTINEIITIAEFMDKIQGVWYFDRLKSGIEFNGWRKIEKKYESNGALKWTTDIDQRELFDSLYVKWNTLYLKNTQKEFGFYYFFRDEDLIIAGYDEWVDYVEHTYKKVESFPEPAKEPYIGMTAQEVLESTWGTPKDINKYTYSWGVREQWCYSGYRYIYFEDGIVTSISE